MLKRFLYQMLVRWYPPDSGNPFFKWLAELVETNFGLANFKYGGVQLALGPVGLLDRFIILGQHINPFVTSAISQHLKDGGIFLDIGANYGVLSLLAAQNPKINVFAFEPSPRELKRLYQNLALNQFGNVNVLAYGIGDQEITQEFVLSDVLNTGMNTLPTIRCDGQHILCRFAPLDYLLNPFMLTQTRVCKIDVEGQEMLVLQSLQAEFQNLKQSVFIIEISPKLLEQAGTNAAAIYNFFDQHNFKSQYHSADYLAEQWEEIFYHPDYTAETIFSANIGISY